MSDNLKAALKDDGASGSRKYVSTNRTNMSTSRDKNETYR